MAVVGIFKIETGSMVAIERVCFFWSLSDNTKAELFLYNILELKVSASCLEHS